MPQTTFHFAATLVLLRGFSTATPSTPGPLTFEQCVRLLLAACWLVAGLLLAAGLGSARLLLGWAAAGLEWAAAGLRLGCGCGWAAATAAAARCALYTAAAAANTNDDNNNAY